MPPRLPRRQGGRRLERDLRIALQVYVMPCPMLQPVLVLARVYLIPKDSSSISSSISISVMRLPCYYSPDETVMW